MEFKTIALPGEALEVRIFGRICREKLMQDREPLQSLLGPEVYQHKLILNLEAAESCDSMGVGWLLQCHKKFRETGGMLVICSAPMLIMQTLKVMHLDKMLNLVSDEAAAKARVNGAAP